MLKLPRIAVALLMGAGLIGLSTSAVAGDAAGGTPARVNPSDLKPHIVQRYIPFGQKRKGQMAAYSKRHYGTRTYQLTDPHVVVEHYTDGNSWQSAWNYFAANVPDLGERPGVCSQFIIGKKGTIFQTVPLGIRCRHAVGLNYTAFGIEHVGTSDKQVLNDAAQMRSSLQLTLWLMAKYDIQVRNVIGHNENRNSPYHHELYPSWRCQTHSDFVRRDMQTYRGLLKDKAKAAGVPIGPKPSWVTIHC
ncbi:MAG: peptidoglycan recognition family protein [Actinomycetota bacterium]